MRAELRNGKSFLEISYCIFEDLNAVPLFIGKCLALAETLLLHPGPIRVIREMIKGLRVGHEAKNPAGGITDASNIQKGAIWVEGPLPFCGGTVWP